MHQSSQYCLVCHTADDATLRDCDTDACPGVYCSHCFDDLDRRCPICLHGLHLDPCNGVDVEDDLGDDYMEREDDLKAYCRSALCRNDL